MTKLHIPQVGDKLKLSENWNCKVFNEGRNANVFDSLNIDVSSHENQNVDITFPKGTVLKVERLYVRGPASSFDSITLRIESSPIKALTKARFWVKLMDANTMNFESSEVSLDNYDKLKSCNRFVALKNGFQNSENLNEKDQLSVAKELFEFFEKKTGGAIKLTVPVNVEELFNQVKFDNKTFQFRSNGMDELKKEKEEKLNSVKDLFVSTNIYIHMLPVLDGFIYYFEKNDDSVNLDKKLDLHGKFCQYHSYRQSIGAKLGSYVSEDFYGVKYNKTELPAFINAKESLEIVQVEYNNEMIECKTKQELEKFIKKVRKINTKPTVA